MVHYRRFVSSAASEIPQTLEWYLRTALGKSNASGVSLWLRVADRVFKSDKEDRQQIVLNRVADQENAIFGELCLIQEDGLQALLALNFSEEQLSELTKAQVFELDERSAPNNSRFIRGMNYWLCIGNHIFLVKLQSFGSAQLYEYMDWLLRHKSKVLPNEAEFKIQAEFDKTQLLSDIGDIKSFKVSGNAASRIVPTPDTNDTRSIRAARKIADRLVQFAQAVPLVRTLLGEERAESLLNALGPEEYLSVDATVSVQGRRTVQSKEQLGRIANELADLTEAKVQIEGKDGRLSDEDAILRTRMPFDLAREGSNFLDYDNVADQLREVYARFVRDRKIAP